MSRAAFEARFPDEASCARHLAAKRWPDGFVCPACGHDRGWELKRRRASWECAACGKETSVTAGTIMHRSHLPRRRGRTGAAHAMREGRLLPVGGWRGAMECLRMLLHVRFENRENRTADGACGAWNTIESGDYSITEFVSENNVNDYGGLGGYAAQEWRRS